ncbi:MAG: hypothetical protein KY397_06695 [Gemmatimonadetes bacterium]|nr:hypothetical protein [Gemmatimonadota bacterium]
MRAERVALFGVAFAVALLLPGPAHGQVEPDTLAVASVSSPPMGTASYDAGGRRDPFVPLTVELEPSEDPRFERLRLTGVFLGSPTNSLVVLEDPARRGFFLRAGQSIGNARLVEIRPQSAVFDITEYGTTRRTVLELERTGEQP